MAHVQDTTNRFRFSPRAKNTARRIGITLEDAIRAVAMAISNDQDADGRHRFVGEVRGIRVRVVLERDDPFLIVTLQHGRLHA